MVLKTGPDRPVTVLIWSDELDQKVIESESDRVNRTNQPVPSELLGSFFFPPGIRATVPLLPATGVLSCWQHPSQNAAKPRRRPLNTPPTRGAPTTKFLHNTPPQNTAKPRHWPLNPPAALPQAQLQNSPIPPPLPKSPCPLPS